LAVNNDDATKAACADVMQSAIRNQRYRLKKKYFNGVPANEVRATSPVQNMTDEEWIALVAHWSDPKNKVCSNFSIFFNLYLEADLISACVCSKPLKSTNKTG